MDIPIEFLIRAGQVDTADTLRGYAEHRLSFALRRFAHQVQHVTVRLMDVNGPRRGVDSRCTIAADMLDGRRIFVAANAAWPFEAITQAARRLNESIRRERGRHGRRGQKPGEGLGRRDSRQLGRVS